MIFIFLYNIYSEHFGSNKYSANYALQRNRPYQPDTCRNETEICPNLLNHKTYISCTHMKLPVSLRWLLNLRLRYFGSWRHVIW
jgi:hypothetical protein